MIRAYCRCGVDRLLTSTNSA